jgi:hypothetical protein
VRESIARRRCDKSRYVMMDTASQLVMHMVIHRLFHRRFLAHARGACWLVRLPAANQVRTCSEDTWTALRLIGKVTPSKAKNPRKQRLSWSFAKRSTNSDEAKFHVKRASCQHGAAALCKWMDTSDPRLRGSFSAYDVHKLIPKVIHSDIHCRVCKLTAKLFRLSLPVNSA